MLRLVGFVAIVVLLATGPAGTIGTAAQSPNDIQSTEIAAPPPVENSHGASLATVLVTLPMTNGFADATDALVETQGLVRDALVATETVRLVDRPQNSDAVLTVLGRGTGYVELTAALQEIDKNVVASPVLLHANERYIEAMLAVGSCGDAATNPASQTKSASCYRKIFVGLGNHDPRQHVTKTAPNSWTACADDLARDVEAWITENASRLFALRH